MFLQFSWQVAIYCVFGSCLFALCLTQTMSPCDALSFSKVWQHCERSLSRSSLSERNCKIATTGCMVKLYWGEFTQRGYFNQIFSPPLSQDSFYIGKPFIWNYNKGLVLCICWRCNHLTFTRYRKHINGLMSFDDVLLLFPLIISSCVFDPLIHPSPT